MSQILCAQSERIKFETFLAIWGEGKLILGTGVCVHLISAYDSLPRFFTRFIPTSEGRVTCTLKTA